MTIPKYKYVVHFLLVLVVLPLFASCVYDDELSECPLAADEDVLKLSFKMFSSQNAGTRASSTDSGVELEDFEEGINSEDIAFFIFVKRDGVAEAEKLLVKYIGFSDAEYNGVFVQGSRGDYTVTLEIKRSRLLELLNITGRPLESDRVSFRLLIVANSTSPDSKPKEVWESIKGETYSDVLEKVGEMAFPMTNIYSPSGKSAEELFGLKCKMPMFGTGRFDISFGALDGTRPYEWVYLGEIDLLRALAKVRVVDNIIKDEDGYPKITTVEFVGSQDNALLLPDNVKGYNNGSQVSRPNYFGVDNGADIEKRFTYSLGTIPDLMNLTPVGERKGLTFIGYFPEQEVFYNPLLDYGAPLIKISVALQRRADGSDLIQEYSVEMANYRGTAFSFGDYLLRNHVYTLSVEKLVETGMTVTLGVGDWGHRRHHIEI